MRIKPTKLLEKMVVNHRFLTVGIVFALRRGEELMRHAMLNSLVITAILAGIVPGHGALGSVQSPSSLQAPAPAAVKPGEKVKADAAENARRRRAPSSFFSQIKQEILAKFRPVDRGHNINFTEAESLLMQSKTTQEKVFNEDFEAKMRQKYLEQVKPFEAAALNPIWRPRYWEVQRYEDSRKGLARWTAREILDDQLHDFIKGGDSSSAPIRVLETARELSGGGRDESEPKLTEEQKIARAHRLDLPAAKEEARSEPVRLKTKINVLKQQGSIVFQNPVATTSVNGSTDEINVNMNKSFPKLTLNSQANYVVKGQMLNVSLNKKITDKVSLALDHYSWTGSKRGASGEKSMERARVSYSVSF